MKGKMIVIEGIDSAGKKTQALMLVNRLKTRGRRVEFASFPSYEKTEVGKLLARYLKGEFKLNSYSTALLFALDRSQFGQAFLDKLKDGVTLVLDRYVYSNLYQAARVGASERKGFVKWFEAVESPLPNADVTVFLDVPVGVTGKLLEKRGVKVKGSVKRDVYEKNRVFQDRVRETYLSQAHGNQWIVLKCWEKKGKELVMKHAELIHDELWKALAKKGFV